MQSLGLQVCTQTVSTMEAKVRVCSLFFSPFDSLPWRGREGFDFLDDNCNKHNLPLVLPNTSNGGDFVRTVVRQLGVRKARHI